MPKAALVLSGGGAKGAFQVAAEKYARVEKGYEWKVISGVSVGALNGVMLAMEEYQLLEDTWRALTRDQVMTGRLNLWSLIRMKFFRAKSIYGNEPLRQMIGKLVNQELIKTDIRIGAVSLETGDYRIFRREDSGFKNAVLASTAIPVIWAPVDITEDQRGWVDGGVRNLSPLGDVLDAEPEEIVVINCSPELPPKPTQPLENAIDIGVHALEIMMNEILRTDIREFTHINRIAVQAADRDQTMLNAEGAPYRYYNLHIIDPEFPLGDTLDFSRESIERSMREGERRARQVLG